MTNDYLQTGGGNMHFFSNPKKLTDINLKVRDAIIEYFTKVDTLKVAIDNRIILD